MSEKKEKKNRRKLTNNQRWIAGFITIGISVYMIFACVCYIFTWKADQSIISYGSILGGELSNGTGSSGALIGEYLIGRGFGIFGLVIPIALLLTGIRFIRTKPLRKARTALITCISLILGATTLGFIFSSHWGIFGSGLGGAQGIFAAQWLKGLIGPIGLCILILCGWILLAVYINRSTISMVNHVGGSIVDNGIKVGEAAKKFVASQHENIEEDPNPDTETEDVQQPQTISVEKEATEYMDDDFEITDARQQDDYVETVPVDTHKSNEEVTDDNPFKVMDIDCESNASESTSGTVLGAGGVITAEADQTDMQVLVAAQKDDEIEHEGLDTLYDPLKELSSYRRPEIEGILQNHSVDVEVTREEITANKNRIVETLQNFGIRIESIKATIGPTVTLYEIVPAKGIKISRIKGLEQDIALSLKALGIRIIAPMPGKGTVGIEVPNINREIVSMYSVIKSVKFQDSKAELPIALGKNIQNETVVIDLAKMPHLIVAGATGMGKSVGLNAIIASLLYKKHPAELKFVMVDPKKVELSIYSKLENHFLAKMESEDNAILTDTQKVVYTIQSLCKEMEDRYGLLQAAGVRKISEYNEKFINRRLNPLKGHRYLPYIVVIIDEFADLIMTAGKEIELPIARLAQLARAIGIHLIIATQRPDANVITGLIKSNCPARIAFRVTSVMNSRIILDQTGAEQLIGQGDMLVLTNGGGETVRVQCAFIDTPEIEDMVNFIARQQSYGHAYILPEYQPEGGDAKSSSGDVGRLDDRFAEIAEYVVMHQQGSTSNIQRRFDMGYNRAGRLMDQLEKVGIVSGANGSKPREVLVSDIATLDRILSDLGLR